MNEKLTRGASKFVGELGLKVLEESTKNIFVGGIISILPDLINLIGTHDQMVTLAQWMVDAKQNSLKRSKDQPSPASILEPVNRLIKSSPHEVYGGFGDVGGQILVANESTHADPLFQNEDLRSTGKLEVSSKIKEVFIYGSADVEEEGNPAAIIPYNVVPRPGSTVTYIQIKEETLFGLTKLSARRATITVKDSYPSDRNHYSDLYENFEAYESWEDVVADLDNLQSLAG